MARGRRGRRSTRQSRARSRMRARARARHARFKKTRVQTYGGTKKSYTKRELQKIDAAGLSRSKVTGGVEADKKPTPSMPQKTDSPKYQGRSGLVQLKKDQIKFAADRAKGDRINPHNVENRLRQIRNAVASFTPISSVSLLNNRQVAQRREDAARFRAANLTRPNRGGSSNTASRVENQAMMQLMQPTTGQTGYSPIMGQTGLDDSQLTRIQNQAYDAAFGAYTTGSGGNVMSSNVNTGTGTSAPSSTVGTGRGQFNLRMFRPLTTRNSGPRNLLNRRGMRITSLNV